MAVAFDLGTRLGTGGLILRPQGETERPARTGSPRDSGASPLGGGGGAVDFAGLTTAAPSLLDQLQSNRNKLKRKHYCGTSSVEGIPEGTPSGQVVVGRVNCKTWGCEYCGPRRAKQYKRAIREGAEAYKLTRLLTVTLDPAKVRGDPVQFLNASFAKLRVLWRRKFGTAPRYIRVLEFQQNGRPHFHLLVDRWMEWRWLKEVWQSVGGGFMVDIRQVDIHRVGHYLNKYLTKQMLLSGGAPKRCRRVTCSRGITLIERKKGTWSFFRERISKRMWWALQLRWLVIEESLDDEGELDRFTAITDYGGGP